LAWRRQNGSAAGGWSSEVYNVLPVGRRGAPANKPDDSDCPHSFPRPPSPLRPAIHIAPAYAHAAITRAAAAAAAALDKE